MKPRCIATLAAVLTALYITQASGTEPAIKISVDWNKTIAVSKTTPTIIACPLRPVAGEPSTGMLRKAEMAALKDLDTRYLRWHMINPARQIAALYPPTQDKTSWDFTKLDADVIPFLEATKGREPILNLTGVPYWMFKTGRPIPHSDIPDDPHLRTQYWIGTKELVDPTGRQLGEYFARIVSWYTKGGFTDENGKYHHSGHRYDLPWWNVLNEIDGEFGGMTPERYTLYYDAIVAAIREVSPQTRFLGLSLAFPMSQPGFFEYFLNPKNHRPGIPLDMLGYHFYAGAGGLGGSSENETINEWQYTFFTQTAAFLGTVRYIESIRQRLAPATRVNLDELGTMLITDLADRHLPEKARRPIPPLYWNLNGAVYAHLYAELAKIGIDVATLSGIYDIFNHPPTNIRSINLINPVTGTVRAPVHVLKLLRDNFGPGDSLMATFDSADHAGISNGDVTMQAFATAEGRKLLLVNKRLRGAVIDLSEIEPVQTVKVVDEQSKEGPARSITLNGSQLVLGSFAVAVVALK